MLQTLAPTHDVSIVTWAPPDFPGMDRKFGTTLAQFQFDVHLPSAIERWLVDCVPDRTRHQRANYLLRMARRRRETFSVMISCSAMEADFGQPGIQYIHFPYLGRGRKQLTVSGDAPWHETIPGLLRGRVRPWMMISGFSFQRMGENLTLANSEWTRERIRELHGIDSVPLYPPVAGEQFGLPWDQRELGFVAVGRFEEAKRFDFIIDTIAQLRRSEPRLRLHVCGWQASHVDAARVRRQARAAGAWVEVHEDLSRAELLTIVGRQRYGIHARIDEHFGMAPAEMARAGCIPFVHASGGQAEIVDSDPRLCFTTQDDAVQKVLAVLGNAALQDALRAAVQARSQRFSVESFQGQFIGLVNAFVAQRSITHVRNTSSST